MNKLKKIQNKLDSCCELFDELLDSKLDNFYKEYLKEALILVETVAKVCEHEHGKTCSSEYNQSN